MVKVLRKVFFFLVIRRKDNRSRDVCNKWGKKKLSKSYRNPEFLIGLHDPPLSSPFQILIFTNFSYLKYLKKTLPDLHSCWHICSLGEISCSKWICAYLLNILNGKSTLLWVIWIPTLVSTKVYNTIVSTLNSYILGVWWIAIISGQNTFPHTSRKVESSLKSRKC